MLSEKLITTIIASYSLDGKSCETCSNSLKAGEFEWNSWVSELSIRMALIALAVGFAILGTSDSRRSG